MNEANPPVHQASMPPTSVRANFTILETAALASAAATLLLFFVRAWSAVSLHEPLLTVTYGAEEELTFALWKYVHGHAVYASPYQPPFAASHYNWLYYVGYGQVIAAVMRWFSLGDAWIPTIAKLVAPVLLAGGAVLTYRCLMPAEPRRTDRVHAAAMAIFVTFGPLIGFWAISVDKEVPAFVCGIAATWAFIVLYPRYRMGAIVGASALSYLAWAFKQSHVFAGGALLLFLLLRRDWRGAVMTALLHVGAVFLTLLFGTEMYRKMILYHLPFASLFLENYSSGIILDSATLGRNLANFASKAGPLIAFVALPFLVETGADSWRRAFRDDRLLFAICGIVVSGILSIPASAKIGAAENYYFTLAFFIAMSLFAAMPYILIRPSAARVFTSLLIIGWIGNALAASLVLAGKKGVLSVSSWHENLTAKRACIATTPEPRFFTDSHLALPWINPSAPYFVFTYNYRLDRERGVPFADGGLAGLIQKGYFATLVVAEGSAPEYDGVKYDGYVLSTPSCAGLSIYSRRDSAAGKDTLPK